MPSLFSACRDMGPAVTPQASKPPAATPSSPVPAPEQSHEEADISYNFRMPIQQIVTEIYEPLAGKKLRLPANWQADAMVEVRTATPITRTAALKLLEEALKQQAHVTILHGADGSLSAIVGPARMY